MDDKELRAVVASAVRAPSVHNTQPWRFVGRVGDDDRVEAIEVLADPARMLEVIDPSGREMHLSCGAVVEFARIATRARGEACEVVLFPEQGRSDLLARIELRDKKPALPEEQRLYRAVEARYTERGRFDERPVPEDLREAMRDGATLFGAWVQFLDRPGDQVTTAVLLAHADEIEVMNPLYQRELAAWVHEEPRAGGDHPDGIPASALPDGPVRERGSSFRLRDFTPKESQSERPPHGEEPPVAEHPLVMILGTPEDDPRAWLLAGQALARILLTAAAEGLAASPMTQVLEVASTRAQLAGRLGLVGYPQIVLRMGYAHGWPTTQRRPVEEVLTSSHKGSENSH